MSKRIYSSVPQLLLESTVSQVRPSIRNAKPFSEFLTDSYSRKHDYLRISVTERCNLRCLYCMPEEGVPLQANSKILTTQEIIRLVKIFVDQGVKKVRLTGGEPTVRKDIIEIVSQINKIDGVEEICLTSNGIALHRKLPKLFEAGLTNLNLSLDTLDEGKFVLITRRNGLGNVLKSLEKSMEIGMTKVKLNVVIIKGLNDDEILRFAKLAKWYPIDIRFIEYMPFEGNKWESSKVLNYKEILKKIAIIYPNIQLEQEEYGDTAKHYTIPGFEGKIGFITSMTDNFCGSCTRLRITSDGNLKVCLFDNNEVSLRDLMRSNHSDSEILKVIGKAVKAKKEKHAGLEVLHKMRNRPMTLIGG